MRDISSVDPKLISIIDSKRAVDLFRELLWAEAGRIGLSPAQISVPSDINTADGGIDAEVNTAAHLSPGGLIEPGIVRYQIKTGQFSASKDSEIKDLFLNDAGTAFKARVRRCFELQGLFVAVLFGSDVPDRTDDQLENACRAFVVAQEPAFSNCRIRILRQNQIAGLLSMYPPLPGVGEG